MASNPPASAPPPKPWERAGGTPGHAPFKPPSHGSTSAVVEASGTARPGEIIPPNTNSAVNTNAVGRPMPARPWQQGVNSGYGGYGSTMGTGGVYQGGGMYVNTMYNRGGYGGGLYTGYRGGMYGGGLGGPMGQMGGQYSAQDPNNPNGQPSSPPGFWISFLRVMEGVVNVFGRIAFLIDQNTQAVHMFMSALLQLFDRGGMLYGELARFVLRLLGVRTNPKNVQQPQGPPGALPAPEIANVNQKSNEQMNTAPAGGWDNVWGNASS